MQKFPTWVEMMHKNEFMAADFLILRVAKKSSISKFFKIREFFCIGKTLATETSNLPRHLRWHLLYADARECVKTMRRAIFFCKVTIMHSYLPYLSNNFEDFFKRPKPYMNFQNLICDHKFHVCSNLKTTFNGIWSYVFLFNLFLLNSCSQITPFSKTTPENTTCRPRQT